jgi:hypothetical protein
MKPTCTFCGQLVYLPGLTEHPCCTFARARGEAECFGCESFRKREAAKAARKAKA